MINLVLLILGLFVIAIGIIFCLISLEKEKVYVLPELPKRLEKGNEEGETKCLRN